MGLLPESVAKKDWAVALAIAAGLSLAAQDAFADRPRHNSSSTHQSRPQFAHSHPHHHFSRPPARIVVAPVIVPRRYYYVPGPLFYPSYPPPVYAAAPPVYPSLNGQYWYFCPDSRAYYPNVLECPSGWLAVVPGGGAPPY